MKLLCVGVGPCRCLVLRYRKANILLDCAAPPHASFGAQPAAAEPNAAGSSSCGRPRVPQLWDVTPFLPLLQTLDLHAALISSAEGLLALPYLLEQQQQQHTDASPGSQPDSPDDLGARGASSPMHHVGPIRGPIYCTQAALDAAEQLAAERHVAEARLAGDAAAEVKRRRRQQRQAAAAGPADAVAAAAGAVTTLVDQTDSSNVAGQAAPSAGAEQECKAAQVDSAIGRLPSAGDMGVHVATGTQQQLFAAACWRRRDGSHGGRRAVRYCLERVRPVRYGQVVSLDSYELTAVPYPSGSGFGHAVWQILDGYQRCRTLLYVPHAAPTHAFAAPLPLEGLRQPDVLLLGPDMLQHAEQQQQQGQQQHQGQQQQERQQETWDVDMGHKPGRGESRPGEGENAPPAALLAPPAPRHPPMQRIKELVLRAAVAGGIALLPVHATGEAWELIEGLAGALAGSDLCHVPLLHVGARARTSLALAAVSMEALGPQRQAAVYRPAHPFEFDALMRAGRLTTFTGLDDPQLPRYLPCVASGCHKSISTQQGPPGPAVLFLSAEELLTHAGHQLLQCLALDPRNLLLLPHAAPPAVLRGLGALCNRAAAEAEEEVQAGEAGPDGKGSVGAVAGAWNPQSVGTGTQQQEQQQVTGASGLLGDSRGGACHMAVAHLPLHGGGGCPGPSPQLLLELLLRLQPHHLLLSERDHGLLLQAQAQQQQLQGQGQVPTQRQAGASTPPLARGSVVPYRWLHRVRLPLPRNTRPALISPDLINRLQWLAVGPDVQVARLNCLLVFRDGCWHADPVPRGAASADAVAAGAAFAAGGTAAADALLLGRPTLRGVLQALGEQHGVSMVTVSTEGETTRVALDGTDAVLLLRPDGAHVRTACPALRHVLTDCLTQQLTAL